MTVRSYQLQALVNLSQGNNIPILTTDVLEPGTYLVLGGVQVQTNASVSYVVVNLVSSANAVFVGQSTCGNEVGNPEKAQTFPLSVCAVAYLPEAGTITLQGRSEVTESYARAVEADQNYPGVTGLVVLELP